MHRARSTVSIEKAVHVARIKKKTIFRFAALHYNRSVSHLLLFFFFFFVSFVEIKPCTLAWRERSENECNSLPYTRGSIIRTLSTQLQAAPYARIFSNTKFWKIRNVTQGMLSLEFLANFYEIHVHKTDILLYSSSEISVGISGFVKAVNNVIHSWNHS